MAVMECTEITERSSSRDKIANKRYTRTFRILVDSPAVGAKEVLEHPALPDYGDIWQVFGDLDFDAFVVEKRVVSSNHDLFHEWIVNVEYVGKGDPTLERAEISWACAKYQVAFQQDVNDVFVVNSAGDPYEGGLLRDRTRFVVTIRKNVLTWSPTEAAEYIDTLNETLFLADAHPPGFDPGLCKLSEVNADAVWYEDLSDIHYWKRQARIEIDLYGWRTKLLDAGFNKKSGAARLPIVLPAGKPTSPVPLDGTGLPLPADADPVFNEFDSYETKDWADLDLEY